jgi:hypothetical protein
LSSTLKATTAKVAMLSALSTTTPGNGRTTRVAMNATLLTIERTSNA